MTREDYLAALTLLENKERSYLLELIAENEGIKKPLLGEMAQLDNIHLTAEVQLLVNAGIVNNHGIGENAQYNLTEKGKKLFKALKENNINYLDE